MAADLVTIATTAVLTQFLTPAAKNLGEVALERAKQVGTKAVGYLVAVGRTTQPVEEKLLLPLVQAASLESDPSLADKWAALLANAADPARYSGVQPGFIEVLRQLTPTDAQVLEEAAVIQLHPSSPISGYIAITLLLRRFPSLTQEALLIVTGNMARLGLCLSVSEQDVNRSRRSSPIAPRTDYRTMGPGVDYIQLTPFCRAFLAAVTPPTK
jgi:hypothetical protein